MLTSDIPRRAVCKSTSFTLRCTSIRRLTSLITHTVHSRTSFIYHLRDLASCIEYCLYMPVSVGPAPKWDETAWLVRKHCLGIINGCFVSRERLRKLGPISRGPAAGVVTCHRRRYGWYCLNGRRRLVGPIVISRRLRLGRCAPLVVSARCESNGLLYYIVCFVRVVTLHRRNKLTCYSSSLGWEGRTFGWGTLHDILKCVQN